MEPWPIGSWAVRGHLSRGGRAGCSSPSRSRSPALTCVTASCAAATTSARAASSVRLAASAAPARAARNFSRSPGPAICRARRPASPALPARPPLPRPPFASPVPTTPARQSWVYQAAAPSPHCGREEGGHPRRAGVYPRAPGCAGLGHRAPLLRQELRPRAGLVQVRRGAPLSAPRLQSAPSSEPSPALSLPLNPAR